MRHRAFPTDDGLLRDSEMRIGALPTPRLQIPMILRSHSTGVALPDPIDLRRGLRRVGAVVLLRTGPEDPLFLQFKPARIVRLDSEIERKGVLARNQAGRAVKADVQPGPLQHNQQAVLELHDVKQVNEDP